MINKINRTTTPNKQPVTTPGQNQQVARQVNTIAARPPAVKLAVNAAAVTSTAAGSQQTGAANNATAVNAANQLAESALAAFFGNQGNNQGGQNAGLPRLATGLLTSLGVDQGVASGLGTILQSLLNKANPTAGGAVAGTGDYSGAVNAGVSLITNALDNKPDVNGGLNSGAQLGAAIGAAIEPGVGTLIGGAAGTVVGGILGAFGNHTHPDTLMRRQLKDQLKPVMGEMLEFPNAQGQMLSLHKFDYNVDFTRQNMNECVALAMGIGAIIGGGSGKWGSDMTGIVANAIYDPNPENMLKNARNLLKQMQTPPELGKAMLAELYQAGKIFADELPVMMASFDKIASFQFSDSALGEVRAEN